jgi:hypothetical protein
VAGTSAVVGRVYETSVIYLEEVEGWRKKTKAAKGVVSKVARPRMGVGSYAFTGRG